MPDSSPDVDAYVHSFPEAVREVLERIRRTAHDAAPGAGEKVSYQIPTLVLDGRNLVHFAAWKHHVSVYPVPDDPALAQRLAPYRTGKGTLQFPLDQPVPYELVGDVVRALARTRD